MALVVLFLALPAWSMTAHAADPAFSGGAGTVDNPYKISSVADLQALATAVNNNNSFSGIYFELTTDITLSGEWTPIGINRQLASNYPFSGTFDGGGHTISGLYINAKITSMGLFGEISDATIKNLGVINGSVTQTGADNAYYTGGIVGNAVDSTLQNCYYTGNVSQNSGRNSTTKSYLGGIVGYAGSGCVVKNCYNGGTVTGGNYVVSGGVAVKIYNQVTVQNCYYLAGSVNVDGVGEIGGSDGSVDTTSKTSAEFNSGEVAYLLQDGQEDKNTLVWGQGLGSTKDSYPVLINDENKNENKK